MVNKDSDYDRPALFN